MLVLEPDDHGLARAAELLARGRPVAFPTETVYGLGALACDADGISAIFAAKDRPPDNPLIVHVESMDQVSRVAAFIPPLARALAERFWPGPLALVLPRRKEIPESVSAGLPTVAVRQPAHPVALSLIRAAGFPLAAPSANRSGRPSPTCAAHVVEDLEGRIEAVLDGGPCAVGVESTVLDLSGVAFRVLRPGGISQAELAEVLGSWPELASPAHAAASPGTRHRHYQPACAVVIYEGDVPESAQGDDGVLLLGEEVEHADPRRGRWMFTRTVSGVADYARELFSILRAADAAGVSCLYLPWPSAGGIGLALRDRLLRAAGRSDGPGGTPS